MPADRVGECGGASTSVVCTSSQLSQISESNEDEFVSMIQNVQNINHFKHNFIDVFLFYRIWTKFYSQGKEKQLFRRTKTTTIFFHRIQRIDWFI